MPPVAAVGAVLERIEAEGAALYEALDQATALLASELDAWWAAQGLSLRVDRLGSLFAFRLPPELRLVFSQTLSCHGVYCGEGHAHFLSTAHTMEDVKRIVDAVRRTTTALQANGLFDQSEGNSRDGEATRTLLRLPKPQLGSLPVAGGVPLESRLRVSDLQHPLLVHQQLYPASTAYNEPIALTLWAPITQPVARAALQSLVRRHAALRTYYSLSVATDSAAALYQIILPEDGFVVPLEFCTVPSRWSSIVEAELRTPFPVFESPPIRALLLCAKAPLASQLIVNLHHVVADAISMQIVRAQLEAHCAALMAHASPDAPPSPSIEYAEYALWEGARHVDDAALSWWVAQLAGAPELITLPTKGPRPVTQDTAAAHVTLHIDSELTQRVMSLCHTAHATLNTVLLTAWAEVLYRLNGDADLTVGVPHSMRHSPELHSVVGMFINTLPIRMRRSDACTVTEAIRDTQHLMGQALQRAHVPLHRILSTVLHGSTRSAGCSPLFQLLFHATSVEESERDALDSEDLHEPTVKVDLEMELLHCGGEVRGKLIYDSELYDSADVERWADFLLQLLRSATMCTSIATTRISELSMMADAERDQILRRFNSTAAAFEDTLCVGDLIESELARAPDRTVLAWEGSSMSGAQLRECSGRVVAWLRAHGLRPDHCVALQLHRSLEQVVGMVGSLCSGGAYLPLDPAWPLDRRCFMIRDVGCRHLITQSIHLRPMASWFDGATLRLDDAFCIPTAPINSSAGGGGGDAIASCTPTNLAYVMFTSGSTGKPKGVMVPHAGVVNLLQGAQRRYARAPGSVFGVPTPYVFDVSVYNILSCFVVFGGCCRLLHDGSSLVMLSDADAITHLAAVPSVLAVSRVPRSVEHVQVGGEALTQAAVANVHAGASLFNYYGPTEASIWATRRQVLRTDSPSRLSSIGSSLPNVTCFVVGGQDHPVLQPIGVYGELWLGGIQLARGYLNRQTLTGERFVRNPWAQADPSGNGLAYRTGDRVRWLSDGEIEVSVTGFQPSPLGGCTPLSVPLPCLA